jgi:flagellar basal-body rod protein FlgF
MSAAAARAAQLESVADNLANTQSAGFKASRPAFQSFLPSRQGGDKILSAAVATGLDLRPGVTVATERVLDVVPDGDSFLSVLTPAGQRAYTRNGHVEIGGEGELLVAGNQLLDVDGQPISVPPGSIPEILDNGEVMADGAQVARLSTYLLEGPIDRSGPSLLIPGTGARATAVAEPRMQVGVLEMGNAPALEATLQMITAQRHFDSAMQAITTYRKLDERAVEVGKVR